MEKQVDSRFTQKNNNQNDTHTLNDIFGTKKQ